MKRIGLVFAIALAAVGLGVLGWWLTSNTGPRAMILQVTGPAGSRVAATLDADGRSQSEEEAVPFEFSATAVKLVFQVVKREGPAGEIRVTMTADGRSYGSNSGLKEVGGQLEFSGREVKTASISGR